MKTWEFDIILSLKDKFMNLISLYINLKFDKDSFSVLEGCV